MCAVIEASRKNIRKHVNRLVDETHSIFSAVENNAESLKDGYNSELYVHPSPHLRQVLIQLDLNDFRFLDTEITALSEWNSI